MERGLLELSIPPEWGAVQALWDPCRGMLSRAGLADDEAYALAMVAQELLENAVKYGDPAGAAIQFILRVAPAVVTVEVRSRVGDEGHLRAFHRTVQWIRGHPDPFRAYVERLEQAAARPPVHEPIGLGLARIAFEGRCALEFFLDAGNTLSVSAVYQREGAEG